MKMSYTTETAKYIDLERNGLSESVNENIRRNRMSSVRIKAVKEDGTPISNAKVEINQTASDFRFGCNAFMINQFDTDEEQEKYDEAFKKLFNQAVVSFYWRDDEPEEGVYRFDKGSSKIYRRPPADESLEWCEKYGIEPKGHNLVWPNRSIGLPQWLPEDKKKIQRKINERIKMIADRYAEKIPVWDVCNEVSDYTYDYMPEEYDTKAFVLADEFFPDNHLILNDYHSFYDGSFKGKNSPLYQIAQKIRYGGGRIDGIGIQHHLFIKEENINNPTDQLNAEKILKMARTYSELSDSLHFSEITIPSYDSTEEKLSAQAKIVENFYRLCFSIKTVKSIVWWNLVDGYAYGSETYYGGGLLKHDFTPKPAYDVLDRLINKEWKTNLETATDENGYCTAEVFHGDYNVTINGKTYSAHIGEDTDTVEIICG